MKKKILKTLKIAVAAAFVYELFVFATTGHYANLLWWSIVLGAGWLDEV